ncbi:Uncharacterized iron-regulated membrane protein [Dyadobacter soli]|uniref:Uncharacterized iron-regulated membrane protein n=1 Tax=Dyadobacter soli TaxID=659014 RepID=A0A1G7SMV6_9BACT|nr:PepSY-associated TM helix domain-containing protein [Dyadobacter soli]SDG23759.1 Uncharacterized iron-regulated membrane protein [Dyadobacter soli]
MKIKKIAGTIHLWLGMAAGLVVVLSMTAAAIFVWDTELTDWYYHDYVFVKPQNTQRLPLSRLTEIAQQTVPGKKLNWIDIVNAPDRAYIFTTYKDNPNPTGWTHWDDYTHWVHVYVNPYTGRVQGVVDMLRNPIDLTRRLHQNMLLRYDIGHYVVGFATVFVMILSITGMVLWWPKNKAARKQRFKIKWDARWRRVNYDVHNVGGFYMHLLILLFAITGLVWTFDWWTNGIYRLLGDDPEQVFPIHESPLAQFPLTAQPLDKVLADVVTKRAEWTAMNLYLPVPADGRAEIGAYLAFDGNTGWDESDHYSYHANTGELFHQEHQDEKTLGAKWRNSNYAIHVGSIFGLPTKILATFGALFLASLPVTGFLIWWGRRKKQVKPVKRSPVPFP